jgi:hypothetical protein
VRPIVLDALVWQARRATHQTRVDGWITPHVERQRLGVRHPIEDFLFDYYFLRPSQLRRWHPGAGVVLAGATATDLGPEYVPAADATDSAVTLDVDAALARRRATIRDIRDLLVATAGRVPQFGCFGVHEWAMVYGQSADEVRHRGWPLRLDPAGVATVVESQPVRCTHYDAYRFFTPPARARNLTVLTRQGQAEYEQPGCLHANMDLYKWAYKLGPLVPSELLADCFALARDIRVLDMRASPYDLAALGHPAVPVETPRGRVEYAAAQRGFAERAIPIRAELIARCDTLLSTSDQP